MPASHTSYGIDSSIYRRSFEGRETLHSILLYRKLYYFSLGECTSVRQEFRSSFSIHMLGYLTFSCSFAYNASACNISFLGIDLFLLEL